MGEWFTWSEKLYSMAELIDNFIFPIIVKVDKGHYGETEYESMSANEVLRLHCSDKHVRVVAEGSQGQRVYSIPATHNDTFILEGQKETRTLEDLVQNVRKPFTIKPSSSNYMKHGDNKSVHLSSLVVKDEYEEYYVKANGITGAYLSRDVCVIPCYVRAQMLVAEGLVERTFNQWKEYMEDITSCTTDIDYDKYKPNQAIMQYSARKVIEANNEYKTLEPSAYISLRDTTRDPPNQYEAIVTSEGNEAEHEGAYAAINEHTLVPIESGEYLTVSSEANSKDKEESKSSPKRENSLMKKWNKLLRRSSSSEPPASSSSLSLVCNDASVSSPTKPQDTRQKQDFQKDLKKHLEHRVSANDRAKPAPPIKPKPKTAKTLLHLTVNVSPDSNPPTPKSADITEDCIQARELPTIPPKPVSTNPRIPPFQSQLPLPSPHGSTLTNLADVPEDIKSLTVRQITDCLRLLNLEQFAEAFSAKQIDGSFLTEDMDETTLCDAFDMSKLDAMKLMRFVRGKRPNME